MRQVLGFLTTALPSCPGQRSIRADTRAVSLQTFTLACGGSTITVVSPTEAARAAQIVGATGVGVLQQVLFGVSCSSSNQVSRRSRIRAVTTCTQDALTVVVLMTPQAKPGK